MEAILQKYRKESTLPKLVLHGLLIFQEADSAVTAQSPGLQGYGERVLAVGLGGAPHYPC